MWQFAEACRGLKDGCLELGIPVTGGNVSLYNQTGETAILPTPGGRRARRDRRRHAGVRRPASSADGRAGLPARRDPRGAVRLGVGARRARPPRRAAAAGRPGRASGRWPSCCATAVGLLTSAPTTCPTAAWPRRWSRPSLRHGVGVTVSLAGDPFVALFSESAGRVLVTVAARRRRAAGRAGRRATAYRSPRSAAPAATPCRSTAVSTSTLVAAARHLDRTLPAALG